MTRIVRTTNSVKGIASTEGKRWDVIEFVPANAILRTEAHTRTLKRDIGISEAADTVLALGYAGRHGMLVEHDR